VPATAVGAADLYARRHRGRRGHGRVYTLTVQIAA
jgi:hypothetical protein